MKASRFKLWGYDAESIMESGYKYRMVQAIMIAADVIIVGSFMSALGASGVKFGTYFQVMLIVFTVTYFLSTLITRRPLYMAYNFLSKVRDYDVECDIICVTSEELYEIMYTEQRVRLKSGDTVAHYVSVLNNTCRMNSVYPYRIYKRLMKHNSVAKQGSVQLYVYSVRRGIKKPPAVMLISLEDELLNIGNQQLADAKACSASARNHVKGVIPEVNTVEEETVKGDNEVIERMERERVARMTKEEFVEETDNFVAIESDIIEAEVVPVTTENEETIDKKAITAEDEPKQLQTTAK